MTHLRKAALWVIAGVLLSLPTPCNAELAPLVFRDGRFELTRNDRIRLDSLRVIQRLGYDSYTIDSVFELFNTGDTVTQWVGIKGGGRPSQSSALPPSQFIRFDAWVDGDRAPFTPQIEPADSEHGPHVPGIKCDQIGVDWMVRQITFAGQAKTTIRVTYEAKRRLGLRGRPPISPPAVNYSWWNSHCWKDKIGKLVLITDGSGTCGVDLPRYGKHRATEIVVSDYLIKYVQVDDDLDRSEIIGRPVSNLDRVVPNEVPYQIVA